MTEKEIYEIEKIKASYEKSQTSKFDMIKALDCRVKLPALVHAYVLGLIGFFVLIMGLFIAKGAIFNSVTIGIVMGFVGIALVVINYPVYKKILELRIRKYADIINALSDELLNF